MSAQPVACPLSRSRRLPLPAVGLVLALTPALTHAEQFVLFDVTFTYTKQDADNSKPSKSR